MKHLLSALALGLALVGCGGGSDEPTRVVAKDAKIEAAADILGALKGVPFVFESGVPGLGTTGSTTVTFTDTSATPAFSVAADGYTATGTTTFGSCIFKVTASTFPAGHPMAEGQTVTLNPCSLNVETAGITSNQTATRSATLLLGVAASTRSSVTLLVSSSGQLTLNGTALGTVTLTFVPVTGAGA